MQAKHRQKLNMLEPGTKMCKAILILLGSGIIFFKFHVEAVGVFLLIAAGVIFILLLILLVIEQHQDEKQYLEAKKNNPEIK